MIHSAQQNIGVIRRNSSSNLENVRRRYTVNVLNSINDPVSQKKTSTYHSFYKSASFLVISIYLLWIVIGTLFYSVRNRFTIPTAFFYTMEAGLSVGFCNPSDPDNPSRIFTILLVFTGSSIVSCSIGAYLLILTESKPHLVPYDATPPNIPKLEDSPFYIVYVFRISWYYIKLKLFWYTDQRTLYKLTIAMWVWLFLGTAYGITMESWDFITSLYWAVTTISTGGLQSPPCLGDSLEQGICNIGIF